MTNEMMASVLFPCPVIGVSMNSRRVSETEAEHHREEARELLKVPVCDVFRHGPDQLIEAIQEFESTSDWKSHRV